MLALISAAQIARTLGDHTPTAEQSAVIEADLAPGLVVAGAGSGKTTTMASRVVYLVLNGLVQPEEVLGLTFTRKAARELSERVRIALERARAVFDLSGDDGVPVISTYDSFAGSLVRDHALRIGVDPDSALITRAAAWQIMADVVESWGGDLDVDYSPRTVTTRALDLANELTSNLLSVDEARQGILELAELAGSEREGTLLRSTHVIHKVPSFLQTRVALLDLIDAFQRRKRELSVVEYADHVAIACTLAASEGIGEALRSRHRAVLLDEFQDTSVAQLGLMADIFGRGHAVTAVGDPHQAIYSWRGASADSLEGFREAFRTPQAEVPVYSLATSWRNDRVILEAANSLSEPLRESVRVQVEPLVARPGAGEGSLSVVVTETEPAEADEIAAWISHQWNPSGGDTAAVLVRSRRQFTPIMHSLHDAGIPAEVIGLSGLLRAPEIVDLRSALTVAHDASRGDAMMRLLTNQRVGVVDLEILNNWARELAGDDEDRSSIVEAVEDPPPETWWRGSLTPVARERVARLAVQLRRIRAMLSHPLADVIASAERIMEIDIEVASRAGADPTAARANLDAFASHAEAFAAGSLNPSLGGFLDWLTAADENERGLELGATEPTSKAVQILTVHAAKGLEWDIVAVAGMSESQFPSYNARSRVPRDRGWLAPDGGLPYPLRGDADSLPSVDLGIDDYADQDDEITRFSLQNFEHGIFEERRLAYVALTRAKRALLMTAAWTPKGKIREISRFLDEITGIAERSGGVSLAPRPEAVNDDQLVYPAYPLRDPAGPRRARLDAAARAVRSAAGASLDDAMDVSDRTLQRAERARTLLSEAAAAEPTAQLGRRLSASATLALLADPELFALGLRRPLPQAPPITAEIGTRFHEWVENYFTMPAVIFEDDPGDILDGATSEVFAEMREAFLSTQWADRRPSAVELALETEVAGYRISCRVDAVYVDADRVEIVDWKTGAMPRGDEVVAQRTFQLELYRLAYARANLHPLQNVGARLVYVAEGAEIVASGLTEAQIVAAIAGAVS